MSELAGPWLNLPLMMIPGTGDLVKDIKNNGDIDLPPHKSPRRKSFYNFFLRHQDAVDDAMNSPSLSKKSKFILF